MASISAGARDAGAFLAFALLFTVIVSCSLDYSQVSVADEMSEQIPDSVLRDFSYTVVENGTPTYHLEGTQAEFFTEQKRTLIEGLSFREYDGDGELITEGRADSAVYLTESENAELDGNLRFYSAIEEASVVTDYLFWDNEHKLLSGNPESRVTISKDSGSKLDGIGFEADVGRRLVDFSGPVSGRYVIEHDE